MIDEVAIGQRYELVRATLTERSRRAWAAAEALIAGRGGISAVSRVTGLARDTIRADIAETKSLHTAPPGRRRRPGCSRKASERKDPTLWPDLERLIDPLARGDPMSPLRWVTVGTRALADTLRQQGHTLSHTTMARLLRAHHYSLQSNRKRDEGSTHPDRNAQFAQINAAVVAQLAAGEQVISVDAKKKELVGNFKRAGQEWRRTGDPRDVNADDFWSTATGTATPYGIDDFSENAGWVNVGVDHNTAPFAVESIRQWWNAVGHTDHPGATRLLITADSGGSNGARTRAWKMELQRLADETGLVLQVCHFPPGTSKWNKVEHRLFACISTNWRGQPLVNYAVILHLIEHTTTTTGLRVQCCLDKTEYPIGRKVTDAEMAALNLRRDEFHGEWNYTISPRPVTNDDIIV